jgi:hypothetical protein
MKKKFCEEDNSKQSIALTNNMLEIFIFFLFLRKSLSVHREMHEQEAWELGSVLSRDLVRGFQSASWRPVAASLIL